MVFISYFAQKLILFYKTIHGASSRMFSANPTESTSLKPSKNTDFTKHKTCTASEYNFRPENWTFLHSHRSLIFSRHIISSSFPPPPSALASEIVPRVGSSRQRDFDVKNASFEIRKKKKILSFSHIFKKCNRAYRSHDTIALGHATRERKQEVKKTDAVWLDRAFFIVITSLSDCLFVRSLEKIRGHARWKLIVRFGTDERAFSFSLSLLFSISSSDWPVHPG